MTLGAWLTAGIIVSVLLARQQRPSRAALLVRSPLHVILWPLFVPVLLPQPERSGPTANATSAFDARIRNAESALADALEALGRELDDPLMLERGRVNALVRAMRAAAHRVSELEGVLSTRELDAAEIERERNLVKELPEGAPVLEVLQRRLEHVERLQAIHRQAKAELERALAEARALSTRLTVLRYEGLGGGATAAARARELTDTVDELCRVLAEARAA